MSSKMRVIRFLLLIGLLLAPASISFGADDAAGFLKKWQIRLKAGEGAMLADLVTIVPTSGRIIVKTADSEEKTMVLPLKPDFKVMEGKMAIEPTTLHRGEMVVLILDVSSKSVLSVYRYF